MFNVFRAIFFLLVVLQIFFIEHVEYVHWVAKKRGGGFQSSKFFIYAGVHRKCLFFHFLKFRIDGGLSSKQEW
jgi:uncharacterized membrane protein